jgi:hypothetical protein
MPGKSKQVERAPDPYTEAIVVHQVLRFRRGYPLERLRRELHDIDPEAVADAIQSLHGAGVVVPKRTRVYPSPALRRLDELDVICI